MCVRGGEGENFMDIVRFNPSVVWISLRVDHILYKPIHTSGTVKYEGRNRKGKREAHKIY